MDGVEPIRAAVRRVLDRHWEPAYGYTSPNAEVYPWQWLWDSCFHAIVWAELGDERCVVELVSALSGQDAAGFVPHMRYWADGDAHATFWGREGTSAITQPPMYGHAVAELQRRGFDVPDELVDRARRGIRFLLDRRRRHPSGLVELVHPWESGADDSPRWDDSCPGGYEPARWWERKGALVEAIELDPATGSPIANPQFAVASVGFNALVAFNAQELGIDVTELVEAIDARWDAGLRTWVDAGLGEGGSGRVRTSDALLPSLVLDRPEAFDELLDPRALGGDCGPAGVHRDEPAFAARTYWRGPAWPQVSYLLWVAARRVGDGAAGAIAASTVLGAERSGYAEYWDPDDGTGLGAIPQSWAGLVVCMRS